MVDSRKERSLRSVWHSRTWMVRLISVFTAQHSTRGGTLKLKQRERVFELSYRFPNLGSVWVRLLVVPPQDKKREPVDKQKKIKCIPGIGIVRLQVQWEQFRRTQGLEPQPVGLLIFQNIVFLFLFHPPDERLVGTSRKRPRARICRKSVEVCTPAAENATRCTCLLRMDRIHLRGKNGGRVTPVV